MATLDQDIRNRLLLARLPAMPQIILKLLELCQADEASLAELAELVGSDAAMTSKVLAIANSAAYPHSGRSPDLLQALNVLGSDLLKTLVISESVFQTFNGFPHARSVDLRAFWKHALLTAIMAREIARQIDYHQAEEAYLCGLLHDVGRLALLAAAPHEYGGNFHALDDAALCEVEQSSLQITHTEAGAWLVGRWNLDSFMADSVLYHHESDARVAIAHPLIRIVHLANLLANHPEAEALPAGLGAACALADAALDAVREVATAQLQRQAELLGIDLSEAPPPAPATLPAAPAPDPVQRQLEEEVRNVALTAELAHALARRKSEPELLEMARQSARILFNLDDSVILRLDETGTALVAAAAGPQRARFTGFTLPLSGGGRLAEAALQRGPSFLGPEWEQPNLAEEQILRTFGTDCLLCLPLTVGSRCLGLLLSGIASWRIAELRTRERLLQTFAAKVAGVLESTQYEQREQELAQAELHDDFRLQSRKVAHEVNNPLSIIKNYLGVLDDKASRREPVAAELAILHEEIDRVGGIVRDFAVNAQVDASAGAGDVNRVLHHLAELFRGSRFLPAGVRIEVQTDEVPAEIAGSVDAVKQILMNLIKNAIEALPQGGLVELGNLGRVYQHGRVFFHLRVRDNGPGLPAAVLERLFSPVRSSKSGANRGLGLSAVHDQVRRLGGSIGCASGADGTAFDILLPAHLPQTTAPRRTAGHKH